MTVGQARSYRLSRNPNWKFWAFAGSLARLNQATLQSSRSQNGCCMWRLWQRPRLWPRHFPLTPSYQASFQSKHPDRACSC